MTTKAQNKARIALFKDLTEIQKVVSEIWVDESLPDGWHYLEGEHPETAQRQKVTLYLDQDVARWFKSMGRGYHERVNTVLRIYRNGVMSGDVKSFTSEYAYGPERVAFLDGAEDLFENKLRDMLRSGRLTKERIENLGKAGTQVLDVAAAREEIFRRLDAIAQAQEDGDEL